MGYRKYSDEFKREVLAMAAEGKRSIAQIERERDITANRYIQPECKRM